MNNEMPNEELSSHTEERLRNIDNKEKKIQEYIESHPDNGANIMSLSVCRKCFQLTGRTTLDDGQEVEQKCGCVGPGQKKWQLNFPDGYSPVFDFNKAYEMCYCCGLAVIRSGSRWSIFYCDDCKTKILKLNKLLGGTLIPIGRHSLMNGVGLSAKGAKDKSRIKAFSKSLTGLFDRISLVEKHYRQTMENNLNNFSEGEHARVVDIIIRSQETGIEDLKSLAFLDLVSMFI
ncbi:MAG: hypothetical protein PHG45_05925 [Dehalococcoidales bacterium]|nr:hypothetical protein [Dehalococcoidales bacterium]